MKSKVLATASIPGGINALIPVIKRLEEEKKVDLVVVGHKYSERILSDQKIKYKTIKDYNLNDVSSYSMNNLLKQEKPNLIFTGTNDQDEDKDVIEQNIVLAGNSNYIPSVSVLDFWFGYYSRFSDMYSKESFKFLPTKIAIQDEYAKIEMLNAGFDEKSLIVTGNPHFDNLNFKATQFTSKEKKVIRKKTCLDNEIIFFYAGTTFKQYSLRYGYWDLDNLILINDFLKKISEKDRSRLGIIFKNHPCTPKDDLQEISDYINQETNQKIKMINDISAHNLILSSDLTLTSHSTLGIEAVYMKKPCISIQPDLKYMDPLGVLTKNNIIPVGYTKEKCFQLMDIAFFDNNYREEKLINQASNFRTDGKATERVTNLIYQILTI